MPHNTNLNQDQLSDAEAAEKVNLPAIFNYFVGPHVPEAVGELLSPEGQPVMVRYEDLDWKHLADRLQANVEALGLPKSIKVYVGDDALDLFDIYSTSAVTGATVREYNPLKQAFHYFSDLKTSHFRGGKVKIPGGLHLNPAIHGKRPPVTALFISIRFANWFQAADYLPMVTEAVLGISDSLQARTANGDGILGDAAHPEALSKWLRDQVGVVYGDLSTIVRLSITT
jgi:hypothetical protein